MRHRIEEEKKKSFNHEEKLSLMNSHEKKKQKNV
jgi:hypothetical protein